jgi:phospholipid/cholesterol/gamma-HCH transport system substrate-binding protein
VNTLAPKPSRILVMIAFASSCVGLLLFLWLSFGGTLPLAPQGYRFSVEFDQAVQLGTEADVRIAGVSVGRVVTVGLDRRTGLTRAEIQVDPRFAPRPAGTRATLRQKSLLGETYVELSNGNSRGPILRDGGSLPLGQVAPTVQLDQILSSFDPATRRAFQVWVQQDGIAFTGRGEDFNAALAGLFPFATKVEAVLSVLRRDGAATSTLLHDGGQVFSAISASPAHLQGLIRNANATFAATGAQADALAGAIRAFPAFLVATRATIDRVARFSATAKPLIDELRPAAVQLSPALESIAVLAPHLRDVLSDVGPLVTASRGGEPALEQFLHASIPWLTRLEPYLGGLVPVIDYVDAYRHDVAGFFANSTASTEATLPSLSSSKLVHYLRISNPVNPEALTAYAHRPSSNRTNPYLAPGGYLSLLKGLPVFGGYLCTANPPPTIGSTIPATLAAVLQSVYYTAHPGGPPCQAQAPLGQTLTGLSQAFPQLHPLP